MPGKYSFTIDPQLRDILDNVALYDVKRCQNAGKLFCRIVDDPLLTQMIHHAHLHRPESFEATSTFGIRTALIFLAQRIHYFSCRVASACPVAWKDFKGAEGRKKFPYPCFMTTEGKTLNAASFSSAIIYSSC